MMRYGIAVALAVIACVVAASEGRAQSCSAGSTDAGRATSRAGVSLTTGTVFVSHGNSGIVSMLDLASGAVTTIKAGIEDPHEVAVSPDGRWGVAADFGDYQGNFEFDGQRLAVIDLINKRVARVIDLGPHRGPHDVMFLPGSSKRVVVTTQTSRHVVEVDVETGQVIAATPTGGVGSHNLAVAADGRTAFTANQGEGTVSRLDLGAHTLVREFTVAAPPAEGIAVTPDGREAWVAFRDERLVRVIDGETGKVLATLPGFGSTERLSITPDGRRALITDLRCREVKVVDVASRRVLGSIADLRDAGQAKPLADSRIAVVAQLQPGLVTIVDIEERRVVARHRIGRRIDGAAWGPTPSAATR